VTRGVMCQIGDTALRLVENNSSVAPKCRQPPTLAAATGTKVGFPPYCRRIERFARVVLVPSGMDDASPYLERIVKPGKEPRRLHTLLYRRVVNQHEEIE
jgi:hypothetical protein